MQPSKQPLLRVETLEVREVPAVVLFNGVLDVRGTSSDNSYTFIENGGRLSIVGPKGNHKIILATTTSSKVVNDVVLSAVKRIYVDVGGGNDLVDGSAITNKVMTVIGGTGNDTILGGGLGDFIYGRTGDDVINGGAGNDQIFGESGNDNINGGDDRDIIFGGNGNDQLSGGAGNDTIKGEYGDDELNGNDGDDRFEGGDGEDTINGGNGNDVAYGQAGDDVINGGAGADRLFGQTGSDVIHGDDGDDVVAGGDGGDLLFGDAGADLLFGGEISDVLNGGDGNDTLVGGGNGDILVGGENTNNPNNPNNPNPTPNPAPQLPANSQAVVTNVRAQWVDGLTADVAVSNIAPTALNGWRIEFEAKFNITTVWNAKLISAVPLVGGGWRYTIENIPGFFNTVINANSQVQFGYNAQFPANTSLAITNVKLNNVAIP